MEMGNLCWWEEISMLTRERAHIPAKINALAIMAGYNFVIPQGIMKGVVVSTQVKLLPFPCWITSWLDMNIYGPGV